MRIAVLFLILIHFGLAVHAAETLSKKKKPAPVLAPVKAAASKTPTTLPKEVGAELTQKAQQCDKALQALNGTINGGAGCARKAEVQAQGAEQQDQILKEMGMNGPPDLKYEAVSNKREIKGRTTKYRDLAGRDLTLSVLTPEEADKVMEKLKGNIGDLKYDHPETGCFPRAHFLGQRLQDLGVEAGKFWFEPSFALGNLDPLFEGKSQRRGKSWMWHVAPFILVDNNGKIEERVVDFGMSSKALPLEEYKSKLSPSPYWMNVQPSNRFSYDMRERWHNKTYYNGSDSANAIQELACVEKDLREGTRNCKAIDAR